MKKLLLFVISIGFILPCFPETIKLKSGKIVEATIVEKTASYIKADIAGIPITYYLDDIESIGGKNIPLSRDSQSKEEGEGTLDIEVVGNPEFINQVKKALVLIKDKAPLDYISIKKYIGRIKEAEHSGMAAYLVPPTFLLTDTSAFFSLTWCAGDIAHDSYHSKLYNDYKATNGKSVPDSVWTGKDVEMKCLNYQAEILQKIGAPKDEIDYVKSSDGSYADVNYDERDW